MERCCYAGGAARIKSQLGTQRSMRKVSKQLALSQNIILGSLIAKL